MENRNDFMIKLEFNIPQLTIIDQALGALPYKQSAPLIAEINRQIEVQRRGQLFEAQVKSDPMNALGQEI